jgi:hypothetical protein
MHAFFILIGVMCVGVLCREFFHNQYGSYRRVFEKLLDFEWNALFKINKKKGIPLLIIHRLFFSFQGIPYI